jgi:7-cyano-7-deazaguanine synthase
MSSIIPPSSPGCAVLVSGGLDSAILVGELVRDHIVVHPLYVQHGLHWETEELRHLRQFLEVIHASSLQPLQVLEMPVGDLYGEHWSITGRYVPDARSVDEAVYLPGRNVLMLAKAMLWCHLRGIPEVALASLHSNPFPDATLEFFDAYQAIVNRAIGGSVRVLLPYAGLCKMEVMQRSMGLPLELTFSCIHPRNGIHCGVCNKCAERRRAFAEAGIVDRTSYQETSCTA